MIRFNDATECINWIESQRRFSPKVSLEKMRKICDFFNNPQNNLKYIHVGGTNGKGSTVSFIKSMLIASGHTVATFTSPYITCFNERISYMNNMISNENLLEIVNDIRLNYEKLQEELNDTPSFFELTTLIAFIYFAKLQPDYVVLEVGLGGLLDSTNIITPVLSIITNVNYDHMHVLGNTREEIALNKLGIVKENVPFITIEDDELLPLFKATAKQKNSKMVIVKKEYQNVSFGEVMTFDYHDYHLVSNLQGFHQCENILLAINAIELLQVNISKEEMVEAIKNTFWPARLQVVSKKPLVMIDGAHNIDGVKRLCQYLKTIKNDKQLVVIFAVSKDKMYIEMLNEISSVADKMILSEFSYKRSETAENLSNLNFDNVEVNENIISIIDSINNLNTIYVFCGSLYFASEVLATLKTHPISAR